MLNRADVRGVFAAAAIVSATACGGCSEGTARITAEEYQVYSAVIRELASSEGWAGPPSGRRVPIGRVVVRAETLDASESPYTSGRLAALARAAMRDHRRKNAVASELERSLDGIGAYTLLPPEELRRMFAAGPAEGWRAFYRRFPDAPGFFELSRVGFAPDGTRAVLYVVHGRDGLWGEGAWLLLEKEAADGGSGSGKWFGSRDDAGANVVFPGRALLRHIPGPMGDDDLPRRPVRGTREGPQIERSRPNSHLGRRVP